MAVASTRVSLSADEHRDDTEGWDERNVKCCGNRTNPLLMRVHSHDLSSRYTHVYEIYYILWFCDGYSSGRYERRNDRLRPSDGDLAL